MSISSKNNSVVLIFGPTGVGKTGFLIEYVSGFGEVVVVDSIQVYRRLDIGSAKATPEERGVVPHHLIDILDPSQTYDVGNFLDLAERAIASIWSRNKVPVLCGGTAFYFWNFLFGLPETPISDPGVRRKAAQDLATLGTDGLRRRLVEVDPLSAAKIGTGDTYRLTRAWEVWLQTNRPLSSFERRTAKRTDLDIRIFSLERSKEELQRRLDRRIDTMLEQGLIDEVRGLVADGYTEASPGLRGIGYAEFLPYFLRGEGSLDDAVDLVRLHSRQYAKRQRTFFQRIPGVVPLDPEHPGSFLEVRQELTLG